MRRACSWPGRRTRTGLSRRSAGRCSGSFVYCFISISRVTVAAGLSVASPSSSPGLPGSDTTIDCLCVVTVLDMLRLGGGFEERATGMRV